MISTPRLELTPITLEDGEKIVEWRNDEGSLEQLFSSEKITLEKHKKWYEQYKKSDSRMEFIIKIRENSFGIGTIGLSSIDKVHKKTEYGILLGEKDYEGKGYAFEASKAIIKYSFVDMSLNKVYLKVFADNSRALSLYRKLGFVEEGIWRQDILKNGVFRDVLCMSILRQEWKE